MKISFDFDGTLEFEDVQKVAKDLMEQGYDVCILTTRYSDPSNYYGWKVFERRKEIEASHKHLFDVAEKLGIKEINFTEYEWKYKTIDKLNIDIHIDDNFREEVAQINHSCKAKAVLYHPYYIKKWEDELYKLIKELT